VAITVVMVSILIPTLAWAQYSSPEPCRAASCSETRTFATHVLLAPGRPSCSGLALLSVTLTWAAPADSAYALSYELGESATSGSGYSYTNVGTGTSTSFGISSGNHYYVVRSVNQLWRGALSPEREVVGVLVLAASCP
jgi:hypothetical protein